MTERIAIIIGAGPAGLTAAWELLERTDIRPIIIERSAEMGGLARTVNYKGYRMDIGGHRFFSKSDRIMQWWLDVLPLQRVEGDAPQITYQSKTREIDAAPEGPDPETEDRVMLLRSRRSSIYFLRKFFRYPIALSVDTLGKLGIARSIRIGLSYLRSVIAPIRNAKTLDQFFINRFGRELYRTFFKSYTEKVWGVPCSAIPAEWGAQRVKGLSIARAVAHYVKSKLRPRGGVSQRDVETSLIEQFLYPKFGPGQMWEEVARRVRERGGEILTGLNVDRVVMEGARVASIRTTHRETGETRVFEGDYFFSTMALRDLTRAMDPPPPPEANEVAEGLVYRDFITVGLLVERMNTRGAPGEGRLKDNWIYIQESDVRLARVQIFNNWSRWLVADDTKVWLGLEYFCNEGDDLWSMPDDELKKFAAAELEKIGLIDAAGVLDANVLRCEKTYPAYLGSYDRFDTLRAWLDTIENLYPIGRNGMHRYNNMDHSMLTAMTAVENIAAGRTGRENIWRVNTDAEYHEEKSAPPRDA